MGLGPDAEFEILVPRLRSRYKLCRLVDDQVERFVEDLHDRGLRDERLLVCQSDHGNYAGQEPRCARGGARRRPPSRTACRDRPVIVSSDDSHPADVSPIYHLPTICESVCAAIPAGVQGRSLWPLLRGDSYLEAEFEGVSAEFADGGFGSD